MKNFREKKKISKKLIAKLVLSVILSVGLCVALNVAADTIYGKVIALICLLGLLYIMAGFRETGE